MLCRLWQYLDFASFFGRLINYNNWNYASENIGSKHIHLWRLVNVYVWIKKSRNLMSLCTGMEMNHRVCFILLFFQVNFMWVPQNRISTWWFRWLVADWLFTFPILWSSLILVTIVNSNSHRFMTWILCWCAYRAENEADWEKDAEHIRLFWSIWSVFVPLCYW